MAHRQIRDAVHAGAAAGSSAGKVGGQITRGDFSTLYHRAGFVSHGALDRRGLGKSQDRASQCQHQDPKNSVK